MATHIICAPYYEFETQCFFILWPIIHSHYFSVGSEMRMKTSGCEVSWKSGERGKVLQGLLIWWLNIWIRAANWLTRSLNLPSGLWFAKAKAKSRALIGLQQSLFWVWQVLRLLYSHFTPYTFCIDKYSSEHLEFFRKITHRIFWEYWIKLVNNSSDY